MGENIVVKDGF